MDVLSFSTIAEQVKKEINHKCGLNLSQTRILLFFDRNNNHALAMGKLASDLNISLSTLSRQLQQKKTKTLISVMRSDKNSSKSICLNQSGLAKTEELKKALTEIEAALSAALEQKEVSRFSHELNLLAKSSLSGSLKFRQ